MTLAQARFLGYVLGAAAGAVVCVIAAVRGDLALFSAGAGLLTLGAIAAPNTPVKTGDHAAE